MPLPEGLNGHHPDGKGYHSTQVVELTVGKEQNVAIDFFERINRPDLRDVITADSPWVIHTMEVYSDGDGFRGQGGLGILVGDKLRLAKKLGIPVKCFSLMYALKSHQVLDGFWQTDTYSPVEPEQLGFQSIRDVSIGVNNHSVGLSIYLAPNRSTYGPFEPGLKSPYFGKAESDHRLYQQTVAGFGNYSTKKELGMTAAVDQLEEFGIGLTPLAEFDDLCDQGFSEAEAIAKLREKYILTNHTLIPAAVPAYSRYQFEHYVLSNMKSERAKGWLLNLIDRNDGSLSLSVLAHTFAGRFNGVSKLHVEVASGQFARADGTTVDYYPITNGIDIERWTYPNFYHLYQQSGIIDGLELPTDDHKEKINDLDSQVLREIKRKAGEELRSYLAKRVDQYGQSVSIPETAEIACWGKRIAEYKRLGMLLHDTNRLKEILVEENVHLILSGKAHTEDEPMKKKLQEILYIIDQDPVLKERVHFIQDYDEELASPLIAGVDIWFNTPRVGKEACGTSWMKALANLAVLISTEDGGVADVKPAHYLKIEGESFDEEVNSLYERFRQAAKLVKGTDEEWADFVKDQLGAYLCTISGSRMWKDYLEFVFPRSMVVKAETLPMAA